MRSSSYRKKLQEQMRSRFHAGVLTDPVEDSVRQACGRVVAQWCREVRCHLAENTDADISSVLFFSYHPAFNLILAWPTYEPMECKDHGPDSILSDNQRVDLLQKRAKHVPTGATAGVSSLFLSRGNVRAVYLDPERTHLVLDENGWSTRDARRSLDPRISHAVGIRDRVYLPIGPYANGGKGAFLVALEETQFGDRSLELTREIVRKIVEKYEEYCKPTYAKHPTLAGTEMVQPLWEQLWHACRDSRTLLPHQASFRRVVGRVLHPEFVGTRNPIVGVLHFDFNSFKRLNEMVGYHNADRVIEDFGRNCCEEFAGIAKPWMNPVSTSARAWCSLQQYAQRPEFAWYFGRIGGDEFGLVYVANSSAISQVRTALEKALEKTEKGSVQRLHLGDEWEPRCLGAYVESHVRELSVPNLDYDEQADALWNDIAASSQQVKNESRHSARGKSRFFCKEVKYVEISPDDKDLRFGDIPNYLLRPHPACWVGSSGRNKEVEFLPASTVHIKSKLAVVAKASA